MFYKVRLQKCNTIDVNNLKFEVIMPFVHSPKKKKNTFSPFFRSFQFTFLIFPKGERKKYIRDISTLFSVIIVHAFTSCEFHFESKQKQEQNHLKQKVSSKVHRSQERTWKYCWVFKKQGILWKKNIYYITLSKK